MKTMKLWPVLALLPLTLVLAACGGSDDNDNNSGNGGLPIQPTGYTFYGVQDDQLVVGDTNNASRAARRTITGVNGGKIVAVDIRPANGALYGFSSEHRLYRINTATGAATQIGGTISEIDGDRVGFDFNPTVDRIRVVDSNGNNLRLNPDTGAIVAIDTDLPSSVDVVAVAYTNNRATTGGTTTLYGLDAENHRLVRIGGLNSNPSPNGGTIEPVAEITTDLDGELGFDITSNNLGFYADREDGDVRIFQIDLNTGALTQTSRFDGAGVDAFTVAG
ncbi:DUF4394 domain-containing protein [bacterium]|nr:MAG: DUF4394 domain-containing protein [bacterium]